ncbi:MAG: hypothetical protein ACREMB_16295 [Candidatus Rokuibacteriota bacterium]
MNPTVDETVIDRAVAEDEAAAAEYGALFRRDIETFVNCEAVEAVVVSRRQELPPSEPFRYRAFVDPSGGSQDSMTLAVAHVEHRDARRILVLDVVREARPPFSPDAVVKDFAAVLDSYHCTTVEGDRYAGEWPRERFREHGITYEVAEHTKSDLYGALLPLLNSHKTESVYRRYAIVAERDLAAGVEKLAALHVADAQARRLRQQPGKDPVSPGGLRHDGRRPPCANPELVHSEKWWTGAESNRRHRDFQSRAFPRRGADLRTRGVKRGPSGFSSWSLVAFSDLPRLSARGCRPRTKAGT